GGGVPGELLRDRAIQARRHLQINTRPDGVVGGGGAVNGRGREPAGEPQAQLLAAGTGQGYKRSGPAARYPDIDSCGCRLPAAMRAAHEPGTDGNPAAVLA